MFGSIATGIHGCIPLGARKEEGNEISWRKGALE